MRIEHRSRPPINCRWQFAKDVLGKRTGIGCNTCPTACPGSESPISDRIFLRAPPTFELPQTSIISWSPAKVQVFRAGFAKIFYRFPHDDVPGAILVKSFVRSRELVNLRFLRASSKLQPPRARHLGWPGQRSPSQLRSGAGRYCRKSEWVEEARRAVGGTEVQLVELRQSFT